MPRHRRGRPRARLLLAAGVPAGKIRGVGEALRRVVARRGKLLLDAQVLEFDSNAAHSLEALFGAHPGEIAAVILAPEMVLPPTRAVIRKVLVRRFAGRLKLIAGRFGDMVALLRGAGTRVATPAASSASAHF